MKITDFNMFMGHRVYGVSLSRLTTNHYTIGSSKAKQIYYGYWEIDFSIYPNKYNKQLFDDIKHDTHHSIKKHLVLYNDIMLLEGDIIIEGFSYHFSSSDTVCIDITCRTKDLTATFNGVVNLYGKNIIMDKLNKLIKLIEDNNSGKSEEELVNIYAPLLNI
jgi:hypothetical protein